MYVLEHCAELQWDGDKMALSELTIAEKQYIYGKGDTRYEKKMVWKRFFFCSSGFPHVITTIKIRSAYL